tara:strand:- start:259 stop:459 length:201 start_codon:yes stop_codon:yes gene_type:complete
LGNLFASAKDAVNEIINLLMSSSKTIGPMKFISPQRKHVDRLKDDSVGNLNEMLMSQDSRNIFEKR